MFDDGDDEDFEAVFSSQEAAPSASSSSSVSSSSLSMVQKERIERNRRKALALKLSKEKLKDERSKEKDSGAGFFIPPEDEDEGDSQIHKVDTEGRPAPFIGDGMPECLDCEESFSESYLYSTFDHPVCDKCKENDHDRLITKTEAKKTFLLKDCDLDRREPPLKFIIKKNPHNPRWGEMKLYLRYQVESRALEVWGSERALEEEIAKVEGRKNTLKKKRFDKKIKELRMKVRGSLFAKKMDEGIHTHTFGEEVYNEEADEYSKTCTECGYVSTYEKM